MDKCKNIKEMVRDIEYEMRQRQLEYLDILVACRKKESPEEIEQKNMIQMAWFQQHSKELDAREELLKTHEELVKIREKKLYGVAVDLEIVDVENPGLFDYVFKLWGDGRRAEALNMLDSELDRYKLQIFNAEQEKK